MNRNSKLTINKLVEALQDVNLKTEEDLQIEEKDINCTITSIVDKRDKTTLYNEDWYNKPIKRLRLIKGYGFKIYWSKGGSVAHQIFIGLKEVNSGFIIETTTKLWYFEYI